MNHRENPAPFVPFFRHRNVNSKTHFFEGNLKLCCFPPFRALEQKICRVAAGEGLVGRLAKRGIVSLLGKLKKIFFTF